MLFWHWNFILFFYVFHEVKTWNNNEGYSNSSYIFKTFIQKEYNCNSLSQIFPDIHVLLSIERLKSKIYWKTNKTTY